MKTWKRYSEPTQVTEAILFNGIPSFTKPSEIHKRGKSCRRTMVFESGTLRRTITLNSYKNTKTCSVECGDNGPATTFQVFSTSEEALETFEGYDRHYTADTRWKLFAL